VKGIILNLVEEAIVADHGEVTWEALLESAQVDRVYTSLGNYPDDGLARLLAGRVTITHETCMLDGADHWTLHVTALVSRPPTFACQWSFPHVRRGLCRRGLRGPGTHIAAFSSLGAALPRLRSSALRCAHLDHGYPRRTCGHDHYAPPTTHAGCVAVSRRATARQPFGAKPPPHRITRFAPDSAGTPVMPSHALDDARGRQTLAAAALGGLS